MARIFCEQIYIRTNQIQEQYRSPTEKNDYIFTTNVDEQMVA